MTTEGAENMLAGLIGSNPAVLDLFEGRVGEAIEAEQLARDMIDWLNCSEPDRADVMRLYGLARRGEFRSWDCPTCRESGEKTRVYDCGAEDYSHFQGSRGADYCSYPGYGVGSDDRRCDTCRCWMKGAASYVPCGYRFELAEDY